MDRSEVAPWRKARARFLLVFGLVIVMIIVFVGTSLSSSSSFSFFSLSLFFRLVSVSVFYLPCEYSQSVVERSVERRRDTPHHPPPTRHSRTCICTY
ncbi:hypothetical protein IWZ03DRAFT_371426 [Phyllosticta citriasiana]|uniref:Uncharacterized protein n=1 Tax=Phyllosticta citriasiana TaxID=595635 RepID=A0ABR1KXX4_9PEZI